MIEKDVPDRYYTRRRDYGPFEVHEHVFLDVPPYGGPFLTVLNASREDGLRLIRGLVEHATRWRREQYQEQRTPFPQIKLPFPDNETFEGDLTVYRWARATGPALIAATALRALESWGRLQLQAGRPFNDVLQDVLGPNGSSVAFLAVAIDLALSHWSAAVDIAWPLAASPRLLQFDEDRFRHDISGVNRRPRVGGQQIHAALRVDLDAQPSRRTRLFDVIGRYAFREDATALTHLRTALEQARDELDDQVKDNHNRIGELRATAGRALRMLDVANWEAVTRTLQDGTQVEAYQFKEIPEEQQARDDQASRASTDLQRMNIRLRIQSTHLSPAHRRQHSCRKRLRGRRSSPLKLNRRQTKTAKITMQSGTGARW